MTEHAAPTRTSTRVAWGVWSVTIAICVATAIFSLTLQEVEPPIWGMRWSAGLWALAFGTVGAVLGARRPGNPIGWLFVGAGLSSALANVAMEVSSATVDLGARLADLGYWVAAWSWIPTVSFLGAAMLLFPTGRPRSPRWIPVLVVHGVLTIAATVAAMLVPNAQGDSRIAAGPLVEPTPVLEAAARASLLAWQVILLVAMGSVIARRFGADATTRRQLRWVAFAAALVFATAAVFEIGFGLGLVGDGIYRWGGVLMSLAIPLIPISIGIAVLRYRLYEIDRILSRTVVYALLTASLAAIYLSVVLVFQQLFTGRSEGVPDAVVAGTTLLIAGVFQPLRRRIQHLVDGRFNRRMVDAERAIDRFGQGLRDEVEPSAIARSLRAAAQETVQPGSVSLWVRAG